MVLNGESEFDKMLKRAVRKTHKTLHHIAARSGVKQPTLWRWMANKQNLSEQSIALLTTYLEKQSGMHDAVVLMNLIAHWQAGLDWLDSQLIDTGDQEDDAKTAAIVRMGRKDLEKRLKDCKDQLRRIRPDLLDDSGENR